MREQFLQGADVVLAAVSDERVAAAWDDACILAGQTIGSLAGHLARGGVWVVGDYLDAEPPTGSVDYETAAAYFAAVGAGLTEDDHAAIRERGATVASRGHAAIVEDLTGRLESLRPRLAAEPADRQLAAFAGRSMRLNDYLWTRIVEQVVHLDDLARSLHIEPWANPTDADALVISCGAEIGRLRHGGPSMIRTLYRSGPTVLPVL